MRDLGGDDLDGSRDGYAARYPGSPALARLRMDYHHGRVRLQDCYHTVAEKNVSRLPTITRGFSSSGQAKQIQPRGRWPW